MDQQPDKISKFADKFIALIEKEKSAEQEEYLSLRSASSATELAQKGILLPSLKITGIKSGLGGKTIASFELNAGKMASLPPHVFKTGDVVLLEEFVKGISKQEEVTDNSRNINGIVTRVSDTCLSVAFPEDVNDLPTPCRL